MKDPERKAEQGGAQIVTSVDDTLLCCGISRHASGERPELLVRGPHFSAWLGSAGTSTYPYCKSILKYVAI
jgi:hypothetical protein